MLALNGIFVLMTQHALEYPQFYNRLYQLLDASAFHVNNRKGFFELLDIFLRSPALPAYLAVGNETRGGLLGTGWTDEPGGGGIFF